MKLHLLTELIDQFLSKQLRHEDIDWYYTHALVGNFHRFWRMTDPGNFKEMYDQCLRSEYSQRWWKRDNYRPKEIMINLIEADPDLAIIAWKDLANDSASLDGRLYRFNYYCDELLQLYRQKNTRSVETYHHQDASIVSLYLAGMNPEKHPLYPGLEVFRSFCKAVGSPDIPVIDDLVRYMKVASIGFTYLQQNKKFELLNAQRHDKKHKVKFISYQLTYELINFTGDKMNIPRNEF